MSDNFMEIICQAREKGAYVAELKNETLRYSNLLYNGFLIYIQPHQCFNCCEATLYKITDINEVVQYSFPKIIYSFDEIIYPIVSQTRFKKYQDVLLNNYMAKVRSIIRNKGGVREKIALNGNYYLKKTETFNDEHKVFDLICAFENDESGTRKSFQVDIETRLICG